MATTTSENGSPSLINISILEYDPEQHYFTASPILLRSLDISLENSNIHSNNNNKNNSNKDDEAFSTGTDEAFAAAQQVLVSPLSAAWQHDYAAWRDWKVAHGSARRHPPVFASVRELQVFNATGQQLVERLRRELSAFTKHYSVRDFVPLYSRVQVGDGWWHVRDCGYNGCVVPIQHLPVSDDLKSRLQNWRFEKSRQCLHISGYHREGHDLEEQLLCELNGIPTKSMTTMTVTINDPQIE